MMKNADLTVVQQTITDTLYKFAKPLKVTYKELVCLQFYVQAFKLT